MGQHREIFERVRTRTGMYLAGETYAEATAFVVGYDLACEGGVCLGFREWLLLRIDDIDLNNLAWEGLVTCVAFPSIGDPEKALVNKDAHRHAIDVLFGLLAEFDEKVRSQRDGLRGVHVDYERWLKKHKRR